MGSKNVLLVTLQSSAVKIVLPFTVSVCVAFSFLAAVLHVEGQNVYYPKLPNMSTEGSLSAQ